MHFAVSADVNCKLDFMSTSYCNRFTSFMITCEARFVSASSEIWIKFRFGFLFNVIANMHVFEFTHCCPKLLRHLCRHSVFWQFLREPFEQLPIVVSVWLGLEVSLQFRHGGTFIHTQTQNIRTILSWWFFTIFFNAQKQTATIAISIGNIHTWFS